MTNEQERGLTVPTQGDAGDPHPDARPAPFLVPLTKGFVETTEYARFAQVCQVCQRYGAIAVCVGNDGVGKTKAARRYTQWDLIEPFFLANRIDFEPYFSPDCPPPRTAFYRPRSTVTPKGLERELSLLLWSVQMLADNARGLSREGLPSSSRLRSDGIDLLVVDEVDRLPHGCLEVLRDFQARYEFGLMLLVRPAGLSRLLYCGPLASQVATLHLFQALDRGATRQVLELQVKQWGVKVEEKGLELFVDRTRGNFATMSNVLMHLAYLVEHQRVVTLTDEVVTVAISRLMIRENVSDLQKTLRGIKPM